MNNAFKVGKAAVAMCDGAVEEWRKTPPTPEVHLGAVKISDGALKFVTAMQAVDMGGMFGPGFDAVMQHITGGQDINSDPAILVSFSCRTGLAKNTDGTETDGRLLIQVVGGPALSTVLARVIAYAHGVERTLTIGGDADLQRLRNADAMTADMVQQLMTYVSVLGVKSTLQLQLRNMRQPGWIDQMIDRIAASLPDK